MLHVNGFVRYVSDTENTTIDLCELMNFTTRKNNEYKLEVGDLSFTLIFMKFNAVYAKKLT